MAITGQLCGDHPVPITRTRPTESLPYLKKLRNTISSIILILKRERASLILNFTRLYPYILAYKIISNQKKIRFKALY